MSLNKKRTSSLNVSNNLNAHIIKEARKIGFKFKSNAAETETLITKRGTEFYDLLNPKYRQAFCKESKLNLFILGQLIDKSETHMLNWVQIKKI